MLINILLILVVVAVAMLYQRQRKIRRDVDTLFRMRSDEIERDAVSNLSAYDDAAARVVDRHVTEYHTRK